MRARIRTQRIARSNRHQLASITFLPALITGWCSTAACSAPAGPNAGTGHQPKISRGERTLCASTLLPITAEGRVMLPRSPHGPAKQIQHADRYRAAECHVRIGEGSRQRLALSAQRVGAVAWPFLLSLPAVHPMVTVPTMFHGRVAVLPVVAIVAAIQDGRAGAPREQLVH